MSVSTVACRVCRSPFLPERRWADECPTCATRVVERCVECGEPDRATYSAATRERMLAESVCFTCDFWRRHVANRGDPAVVIIGAQHYYVREPPRPGTPSHCLGFGGHRFEIRWLDGRTVETINLWGQGEIPERFRDRLPPNAEWIKRAVGGGR